MLMQMNYLHASYWPWNLKNEIQQWVHWMWEDGFDMSLLDRVEASRFQEEVRLGRICVALSMVLRVGKQFLKKKTFS